MADETVTTQLLLDAKQALAAFREFQASAANASGSVKSLQQRIVDFEKVVASEANKANVSFERQLALFKELNAQAMSQKKAGIFGRTGGVDPFAATQQLHTQKAQQESTFLKGLAQRQADSAPLVEYNKQMLAQAGAIGKVVEEHNKLGTAAQNAGKKSQQASAGMVGGINLVRLALHVLASAGIFAVIGAFTKLFSMAINGLKELEGATYNLVNAEEKLSKMGVDITPKGLDETIKKLQALDPLLSKIQASEIVSTIATKVAPSVGFNAEEIDSLAQSIAILTVRNKALGKSTEEVESQVINAYLSGKVSVGINQLGVKISDQIVKEKALAMKLVETAEAYEKLNAQEEVRINAKAMNQILKENTDLERSKLPEYFATASASFDVFNAKLQDFLTEVGVKFGPLLIQVFQALIRGLEMAIGVLDKFGPQIEIIIAKFAGLVRAVDLLSRGDFNFFKNFDDGFKAAMKSYEEFSDKLDTPTTIPPIEPVVIDTSQAEKELEDLLKDLEKIQDKIDETESDHKLKISRFDQDAGIDRSRAVQDYNLNVLQATRAFNLKKKDSNKKYRQKEIEEERKFHEEMRKMQEDFLFSLEDALHERDARAILRLVEKHRMDKEAAENAETIRRRTASEQHASEQQDDKKQLEEKLRVMAEDQAIKMQRMDEDSALKRQRMEEDHAIEMAKLKEQLAERIQEAATKMAEELGVNAEGAQAIHDLLAKYYGTDGAMRLLAQEGYAARLQDAAGFMAQLQAIVAQSQAIMAQAQQRAYAPIPSGASSFFSGGQPAGGSPFSPSTAPRRPSVPRVTGFAEGGQFVATRPTPIMVGEGGEKEFVSITPFSQMQGSSSMGGAGMESMGGTINLEVTLSPDLKVEIIESTMRQTAQIVTKIRRSK